MRLSILALLPIAACASIGNTRTYAGPQTPLAGTCDPPARATLTRRGNAFLLAPSEGTLSLSGEIAGSTLSASSVLSGADKKPYALTFAGQMTGTAINGTLTTPRCRYALTLELTDD